MAEFKVVEKFVSINGEGRNAGKPAVFIRFKGCNLRCSYCDTMWANEEECEYELMTEDEIYAYIKEMGIRCVTLTGGEPLIQKDLGVLLNRLCSDDFLRVEIETNGSVLIEPFMHFKNRPSFTLDYKCPSSLSENSMNMENYKYISPEDTLKFVCGSFEDLEKAKEVIEREEPPCPVYLSPVFGRIEPAEIVDFIIKNKLNNVNLQLQLHKFIWSADKRGV
ncbi:MAG: putative 7-carboxy-7-deazaguanine synthase QueE [Clostridiales bacterium]|nr:putative 7-carboxy-7-deazaguanine synthase QueE [Clostridiales bacterium]